MFYCGHKQHSVSPVHWTRTIHEGLALHPPLFTESTASELTKDPVQLVPVLLLLISCGLFE